MLTYQRKNLSQAPAVAVVYSNRLFGNMDAKYGNRHTARANQIRLLHLLDPSLKSLVKIRARGLDHISYYHRAKAAGVVSIVGDGIITNQRHTTLALFAADCMPVVMTANQKQLLGLIHVGLNGANLGIHRKAINIIANRFKVQPQELKIFIGPHIKQQSYKLQNITAKKLSDHWSAYVNYHDGYYHIDLTRYVVDDLIRAGVVKKNILVAKVDTGANQNYFSHRRSRLGHETEGRNGFMCALL